MPDAQDLWTLEEARRLRETAERTRDRSAELKDEGDQARVDREQTLTRCRTTRNSKRPRHD
jgi:hypothetical protein